jgi:hypothetical protein
MHDGKILELTMKPAALIAYNTYICPSFLTAMDLFSFSPMSLEKSKPVMHGALFSSSNTFDGHRFK